MVSIVIIEIGAIVSLGKFLSNSFLAHAFEDIVTAMFGALEIGMISK
ncbi:hypothetical protein [Lutispora thermophila]|uniref:Uncharacterized protein n=1 Tax=Lutispora thermophila DSM 19022 TaxID=1122184 RepID=A0A1M6ARR6_9FIRM|nr:hypothetical protein [Lutispora thermophila]SHI39214.1 hypothetical protein SAMN02745176_00080 [Lutispora thermophila DSM 19022]